MTSRRLPHAAVVLAAAAILVVTLVPAGTPIDAGEPPPVFHGPFPVSDLLRNLILFAPLGASLAWSRVRTGRVGLAAAVLSVGIELAQHLIPGRDPNPVDVAANVAGAMLGSLSFRTAPVWLCPPPSRVRRLALIAGVTAAAVLVGTGILLAPAPTAALFYGHHTPSLAHLAPYGGNVLAASIDDIALPRGPLADSDAVRARLRGDYHLRVDARAGSPPESLAAFLLVTDAAMTEILLLGPDQEDLLYRFRNRGVSLGLEPSTIRLSGALRHKIPGDRVELDVQRTGADFCLALDGAFECGRGFTAGRGWLLLAPEHRILAPLYPLLDSAWLAALFLPLGCWSRANAATAAAWIAATAALFLVPPATGLLTTPASQLASAGFGALLGLASRRGSEALSSRIEARGSSPS